MIVFAILLAAQPAPAEASAHFAIVHTGETNAVEGARLAAQQLGAKLHEATVPLACARDSGCPQRPPEKHLLVVSAGENGAVTLELVDVFGAALAQETVAVEDPSLLSAALAPALDRVKAKIPPPPSELPPADAGTNGWLIAGAVGGGACALIAGAILVGALGGAGARIVEGIVNATCGAACSSVVNALCTAPLEGCTGAFGGTVSACASGADVCSGPDCNIAPDLSCDVPTPSCNVGSCALPAGSAPLGMRGLEAQPTEEAPVPGAGMAY